MVEAARAAWERDAVASLLQLDIKGAYDRVNHTRLLDTLRKQGFPSLLVRWIRSYLDERSARLRFDGTESDDFQIHTGVP